MTRLAFLLLLVALCAGCRDGGGIFRLREHAPVVIITTELPDGVVGQPYIFTLIATGGDGNYVWKLNSPLPDGLILNPLTGVISGTPTTATPAGTSPIMVRAI